jgi:hypothetical protein
MPPINQQGGELVVIGHDKVKLRLLDMPHRIEVYFKHKSSPPPCDPHPHKHPDMLSWDLHRSHGRGGMYTLNISWKVHEYREIIWRVYY